MMILHALPHPITINPYMAPSLNQDPRFSMDRHRLCEIGLIATIFIVVALTKTLSRIAGGIFVAAFAVYLVSIGYGIYKGELDIPEDSDGDSSDDEGSVDGDNEEAQHDHIPAEYHRFSPTMPAGSIPHTVQSMDS